MDILQAIMRLRDPGYADFQSRLLPGIPRETVIGVRVPDLRRLAREIAREQKTQTFLCTLPHTYYDENLLHAILLSAERDVGVAMARVEAFLPYVDNWAVCDTLLPHAFGTRPQCLGEAIDRWLDSPRTYTCRFGIRMLMVHYLGEAFESRLADRVAAVRDRDYYVTMACAWYFAEALARQWDTAVGYLTEGRLCSAVHRQTVRKACESFRISPEKKAFLRSLPVPEDPLSARR